MKNDDPEAELSKPLFLLAERRCPNAKNYWTTMGRLLDKYEDHYKNQASFSNSKCYYLKNFEEYFGRQINIKTIQYFHLKAYRKHISQKPTRAMGVRAIATVNREMACLHHIFQKAVEWDLIKRNPFGRGKSLLWKENNKRVRVLGTPEITSLLSQCSRHLRPIVVCALNTGMRRSEILGLEWSQVRDGFIYLSNRQVPVNETMESLFEGIKHKKLPEVRNVFTFTKGEHRMKDDQPVRERKGPAPKPHACRSIRAAFGQALNRAGITDFRFQDLRHTFAIHMIMRGASLKDLQKILGLKSKSMILRYAHFINSTNAGNLVG